MSSEHDDSPKQPDTAPSPAQDGRVVFDYIKSNFFRVVHADGAWAGLTPSIDLHVILFNERVAIPQQIVHSTDTDGNIGEEIVSLRKAREGIVREVEVGIIMNLARAKALVEALHKIIDKGDELLKQAQAEDKSI